MDCVILCIGNRVGGDDSVGPYIAHRLQSNKHLTVIDAGTVPENYTSIIKKHHPKQLIIIDAAEMNLNPGEVRIVPKERIGRMHISTHGIPISVFIDYLERDIETIIFIGIQPKTMTGNITNIVRKSAEKVIELIQNCKLKEIKIL
jgi:hydrogenase 3 maturation protease